MHENPDLESPVDLIVRILMHFGAASGADAAGVGAVGRMPRPPATPVTARARHALRAQPGGRVGGKGAVGEW